MNNYASLTTTVIEQAITSLGMNGVKKQSRSLTRENTSCPSTDSTISFVFLRMNCMAGWNGMHSWSSEVRKGLK